MMTDLGSQIPLGLLSSASISVPFAYSDVYISHIYCKGSYINVTIRDNKTNTTLGSFGGTVTTEHQALTFTAFVPYVAGTMTAGVPNTINQFSGSHSIDATNGRIEDSLVMCFTRPPVTSLTHEDQVGVGLITLDGENITIAVTDPNVSLTVNDKSELFSNADFSTEYGFCPTPIITHINGVTPDEDGNIDIFGINPIKITLIGSTIQIDTGTMTLDEACKQKNGRMPPTGDTTNEYHGDILTVIDPEWKTW